MTTAHNKAAGQATSRRRDRNGRANFKRAVPIKQMDVVCARRNFHCLKCDIGTEQRSGVAVNLRAPIVVIGLGNDGQRRRPGLDVKIHGLGFEFWIEELRNGMSPARAAFANCQ